MVFVMLDVLQIDHHTYMQYMKEDPRLCWKGLSDQSLDYLYHKGIVPISSDTEVYGVYEGASLICCLTLNRWNERSAYVHIYLSTHYKSLDKLLLIKESMLQYIKERLHYCKLVSYVPHTCKHAIWCVKKLGFTQEGKITQAGTWRQRIIDYLVYSLEIK